MPKTVDISPEVRDVLARGEWAGWLYRLPEGQLPRPLYEAVDRVLRALGGKWSKAERGHMFSLDAKAAMVAALEQGHVVDQKRTLEQFGVYPLAPRIARGGIGAVWPESLFRNGCGALFTAQSASATSSRASSAMRSPSFLMSCRDWSGR